MTEPTPKRRKFITFGETIALAALAISGAGLWLAWKDSGKDGPTRIVEQKQAVPLTLRGRPDDDGRALEIMPVEPGHGLQSLTVTVKGGSPIDVGSDGILAASDLERALGDVEKKSGAVSARVNARYVEAGADRSASRDYRIRYRWEGGGLFNGRSLRITGFSR